MSKKGPQQKNRHIWLTFAGALIVFFTFILKEGYRDHLKESIDSVTTAENVYNTKRLILPALRSIAFVYRRTAKIRNNLELSTGIQDVYFDVVVMRAEVDDINETAAYLGEMMNSLPENAANQKTLKEIEDKAAAFSKTRTEVNEVYDLPVEDNATNMIYDNVRMLVGQCDNLRQKVVESFEQSLKEQTIQFKRLQERKLRHATIASYILYVIGWGLALIGRVKGLGEIETA